MRLPAEELTFYKSSYSGSGDNCVEVARFQKSSYSANASDCVEVASFRKSSRSGRGDNCVEVADLPAGSAVRDTQYRDLGTLAFSSPEWSAALRVIRTDQT